MKLKLKRRLEQSCKLLIILWVIFSIYEHLKVYLETNKNHPEDGLKDKGLSKEQKRGLKNTGLSYIVTKANKIGHIKTKQEMKPDKGKELEKRVNHMERICKEFKDSYEYKHPAVRPSPVTLTQVTVNSHTILWCSVLKAGFSNFRDTFKKFKVKWKTIKIDTKQKTFRNYSIRLMNVRNPWERLMSSYVDRIVTNHHPPTTTRNKWGRAMMAKYRHLNPTKIKYDNINVTFSEFLQYIVENPRHDRGHLEPHWMQYFESCKPCDISYNYITKIETLTEDAGFLFKQIGIDKNPFNDTKRRSRAERLVKFYKDVPSWIIKRLITIYYWDFRLFGYDLDLPTIG